MLSKYETWLQTAKSNESITYHEGYLEEIDSLIILQEILQIFL